MLELLGALGSLILGCILENSPLVILAFATAKNKLIFFIIGFLICFIGDTIIFFAIKKGVSYFDQYKDNFFYKFIFKIKYYLWILPLIIYRFIPFTRVPCFLLSTDIDNKTFFIVNFFSAILWLYFCLELSKFNWYIIKNWIFSFFI